MLPKKRTIGSETGRQRREEKELTGAEYEFPPEGCPRSLFLFVDAVSGGFLKKQKSHPFTKYLRFSPRLSSLLRTDGALFF